MVTVGTMSIQVINPRTGTLVGEVPALSANDTRATMARARAAQVHWAQVPAKERGKIALKLHDLVLKHQAMLLKTIQAETGKNKASAMEEVLEAAISSRYYGRSVAKLLAPKRTKGALPILTRTTVTHSPVGVVGLISPWNYPLTLTLSDAVPALMAGNAVVVKPDSKSPFTALAAARLAYQAGIPEDVFQIVTGHPQETGTTLAEECDYLMFTGSTATGRILGEIAGRRLIGFSAELGGKNPMIILPDADIKKAVRGTIQGSFTNTGQVCISNERVYVHESLFEEFTAELVAATKALKIGTGGWSEDLGCLITPEHAAKVDGMVQEAVEAGAALLAGGLRPDLGPTFVEPYILRDVPDTAAMAKEEVFGPVVALYPFSTEEEVIVKANDSSYGLSAAVFGKERAQAVARQLHTGAVNINDGMTAAMGSVDAPMGGWKNSGVGRRHGAGGLLKFTETTTIADQRLIPIAGPARLPRRAYARIMTTLLRAGKRVL